MHELLHHLHHLRFGKLANKELHELYLAESLKTFVASFVVFFIPVYLYQLGYSLAAIFFFHGLQSLFRAILQIPTALAIGKWGAKHTLAFSYLLTFIFFLMMSNVQRIPFGFALAAFVLAASANMHWLPYHVQFSKIKHVASSGKEVSMMNLFLTLAIAGGPLAGGLLASRFGLGTVFAVVPVLLIVAAIPLFRSSELIYDIKFSPAAFLQARSSWRDTISFTAIGLDDIVFLVFWPLLIFLTVSSLVKMGTLYSVVLVVSISATYIVGRYADRVSRSKLVASGSVLGAASHLARIWANSFGSLLILSMASKVYQDLVHIPFSATFYEKADRPHRVEYVAFQEATATIVRALYLFGFAGLALVIDKKAVFTLAFVLAAAGILFVNSIYRPRAATA